MKNITWLDGKDASGMFIIEMMFDNGGIGFVKKSDFAKALSDFNYFWSIHPGIVSMKIYDPSGNVIANNKKENVSVAC